MSRLNPNAGAFVPSFAVPAATPSSTAAADHATAAAAKASTKNAKPAPIVTAREDAVSPAKTAPSSGKTTPATTKPATATATSVGATAAAAATLSEDNVALDDVDMEAAAATSDRLVYSIDYLMQFQPICDVVPCYFPDVVRAPAPQRLGRYINDRLVYTVPELLHFQPLYQMFPPDLEWSDTLAIVVESVDKKAKALTKPSKKEKAKAKAAAAAAAAATGVATDQLQYDPTLMCYFNPTEYAAALSMAAYGSNTAASGSDKSVGASSLSPNGQALAEIASPVDEATVAKQKLTALLNDVQPESISDVLKAFEKIQITCTETLQEIISQLFDRAIAEPALCDAYAQLCSGMAERTPEFKEGAKTINFRRILLTRCYEALIEEPETPTLVPPVNAPKPTANGSSASTAPSGSGSIPQHSWRRRCMLQNVCFVGELFRRQLLTENIMHVCVAMMLEDEVNPQMNVIDAACRLLMLVGDLLDGSSPASRRTMDEYFDVLQRLADHDFAQEALKDTIAEMTSVRAGGWAKKRQEATAGASSPAKDNGVTPLTPLASSAVTSKSPATQSPSSSDDPPSKSVSAMSS